MKKYLERFNASSLTEVSFTNLTKLQDLHMQSIPFENLDVIRRVPIYLNLQTIYEKIVNNNRGGYCYELNGLFHWLLNELGYNAHLIPATVKRPNGVWAKADTHAALLVQLDKPYLVDVGFGAATPRLPIALDGSEGTDISSTYLIHKQADNTFDLIQKSASDERTLYRFSLNKKNLVDFHEGCVFNQVSASSSFTHTDIITQATPTGQMTLSDHTFSMTEDGVRTSFELSADEKVRVLQDKFKVFL